MTQLVRHLTELSRVPKGGVVTIGNFDGIHLGHQALLHQLIKRARAIREAAIVMTFEPLPQTFFRPDQPLARLSDWRQKFTAFAALGVDWVLMLPFNANLAKWTAAKFQNLLKEKLQVKEIVLGHDFRFGAKREGNVAELQANSDWQVHVIPDQTWHSKRISSTRIRKALALAQFDEAKILLGHPWTLEGCVTYGEQRGRQLGFPTANILLKSRIVPVSGVYAVETSLGIGVANVGMRPTVGGKKRLLEVHLLDFQQEIYGCRLQVTFCHKIREECRFETLLALKEQIAKDVKTARDFFSNHSPWSYHASEDKHSEKT